MGRESAEAWRLVLDDLIKRSLRRPDFLIIDGAVGGTHEGVVTRGRDEPTRLAAVRLLWDGREHCVCELMRELGATQSRMSRHMAILKTAGLVADRRDAQWVRYRRSPDLDPEVTALVDAALAVPPARRQRAA